LDGGIRDMYPSNDWFFLHCSDDGPWCKPCAEKYLVFNPKCGQCEKTKDGPCTGPRKYINLFLMNLFSFIDEQTKDK